MTWQQNVSLLHHSRSETITDALTGPGNRRPLERLKAPVEGHVWAANGQ